MLANHKIWWKVWNKYKITFDNSLLEYLTCSTDVKIIEIYFTIMMEHLKMENNRDINYVNIILLMIAKHAKKDAVLNYILKSFSELSANK